MRRWRGVVSVSWWLAVRSRGELIDRDLLDWRVDHRDLNATWREIVISESALVLEHTRGILAM